MHTNDSLAAFVAKFWGLPLQSVSDRLRFDKAQIRTMSSLRFFRFVAAVEGQFGGRIPDPAAITSYADLRAAMGIPGSDPSPAEATPAPAVTPGPRLGTARSAGPAVRRNDSLRLGHDIEIVSNMPAADDYRTDRFYTNTFTPAEIAYCLDSTNPPQHFAARFCAKEAVRKCGEPYASLQMQDIEVTLDAAGMPGVRISPGAALDPGASVHLSLSHSGDLASAVVVITKLEHQTPR